MNSGSGYERVVQDAEAGDELLLEPDVDEDAIASAVPMIQVTAPATLSEGYKLDVQVGPRTFTVTVPPGGVQEGQTFQVPLPSGAPGDITELSQAVARISVPTGQWRDGLCDCFSQGICHPVLWNSWFCHTIMIGQIMARMKLNLMAKPMTIRHGAKEAAKFNFQIILGMTVATLVLKWFIMPFIVIPLNTQVVIEELYDPNTGQDMILEERIFKENGGEGRVMFFNVLEKAMHAILGVGFLYWATCTRAYIRSKYGIPARYCSRNASPDLAGGDLGPQGCHIEDFCCSFWCACCTLSQMARHTMEYETYPASCCTPTGVRDSVPDVV